MNNTEIIITLFPYEWEFSIGAIWNSASAVARVKLGGICHGTYISAEYSISTLRRRFKRMRYIGRGLSLSEVAHGCSIGWVASGGTPKALGRSTPYSPGKARAKVTVRAMSPSHLIGPCRLRTASAAKDKFCSDNVVRFFSLHRRGLGRQEIGI